MKRSPIIKKIVLFGILSVIISLMLACLGFGILEFFKIKSEAVTKVHSQMDILAYSLQPTLVFDDKDSAQKILLALREDRSINRIMVYRNNGREFTSFIHVNSKGNFTLAKDILYNNKRIGRIVIDSVYLGIKEKYITYLWISLLIMSVSIPVTFILSGPIRKQVSLGVFQLERQSTRLRLLANEVAQTEQMERKRIAAIIHDHLQQILVAGKLQLSLVVREMGKGNYEKSKENLARLEEFINEATRAARTLTVELRPPVLYEDGLVAAFQWLAKKFKDEHDLEIALNLGDIPRNLSDTVKIMVFEAVKEMLFNIVKYSGVHKASLSLQYISGEIHVSVKDNGQGFDVAHMERRSSDKGFGLFSIRERLRLFKGELNISSQPGYGTQIEMSLPVDITIDPEVSMVLGEKEKTVKQKKKTNVIKVLLADDHKIVREGLANILKENLALDVIAQAENGQEAVEKTEKFFPDVIVMDINMPKLNGIEATRLIKKRFANIDIIGLSVQNEEGVKDSMKKAGAIDLLNKAGDPQDLIKLIINCRIKNIKEPLIA